jgi:hypothetical protein
VGCFPGIYAPQSLSARSLAPPRCRHPPQTPTDEGAIAAVGLPRVMRTGCQPGGPTKRVGKDHPRAADPIAP